MFSAVYDMGIGLFPITFYTYRLSNNKALPGLLNLYRPWLKGFCWHTNALNPIVPIIPQFFLGASLGNSSLKKAGPFLDNKLI